MIMHVYLFSSSLIKAYCPNIGLPHLFFYLLCKTAPYISDFTYSTRTSFWLQSSTVLYIHLFSILEPVLSQSLFLLCVQDKNKILYLDTALLYYILSMCRTFSAFLLANCEDWRHFDHFSYHKCITSHAV